MLMSFQQVGTVWGKGGVTATAIVPDGQGSKTKKGNGGDDTLPATTRRGGRLEQRNEQHGCGEGQEKRESLSTWRSQVVFFF